MKPMSERRGVLWGKESTIVPYRLDATFGAGQIYFIEAMEDRPNFYVFEGAIDLDIPDRLDDILTAIEYEAADLLTDEEWAKYEDDGFSGEHRKWPMPPSAPSAGWSWGEFDQNILGANNTRTAAESQERLKGSIGQLLGVNHLLDREVV